MFVKVFLILLLCPYLISTELLELTDKTWKDMLCGQWMVEFYAPWCSACQRFKSTWNDFSKVMTSKDVKVAAVNVELYPSLSSRFRIAALPTIYYVRDGVFRQFNGERSLNGLKKYIEFEEWQRTEPISSYFGPNSILTSLSSSLFDVSILFKELYSLIENFYGWPAWVIYMIFGIGIVAVGLLVGFIVLMGIEYCVGGKSNSVTNTISDAVDEDDTSSTPEQESIKNRSLIDENQGEELNTSDAASETDEEEQTTASKTVRQRRLNK